MDFSLAYVKSKKQFILKNFAPASPSTEDKWIEWGEIAEHPVQGIIFSDDLRTDQEFMSEIQEQGRHLAVRSDADLHLSFEQFQGLDHTRARTVLQQIQRGPILQSNLSLLEDLFDILKHLKELYPDDRMSFFEELWFLLKGNLGAKDLKIIYNDIPDKEKNTLIQVMVSGERHPGSVSGKRFPQTLMKEYRKHFGPCFEIIEYNEESHRMAAVASINKSPVIIMAEVLSISRLQRALLKALFNGLQM